MTGNKNFSLHKRTKKNKKVFYCQFKNPDGSWSTAKSTGIIVNSRNEKQAYKQAVTWAVTYLQNGKIIYQENVTFGEFAKDFFSYSGDWARDKLITGKRISEKWCHQKQQLVNRYLMPILQDVKLTNIDKHFIKKIRNAFYYEKQLSGGTVNHIMDSLKQILIYAEDMSLIQAVPRFERVSGKPKQETGVLSMEEAKRLFFQTEWDDYMSFVFSLLCAVTGARKGEALALQLKNIHPGYIEIAKTYDTEFFRLTDSPKNGKTRNIVITDKLQREIDSLIDMNPYNTPESFLFFSYHREDRPIDQKVMIKYFYRALQKIGVNEELRKKRRLVMHSHRHFANTIMIAGGVNIQQIQATIGHLDDRMTEHYYHAQIDDMTDIKRVQDSLFESKSL